MAEAASTGRTAADGLSPDLSGSGGARAAESERRKVSIGRIAKADCPMDLSGDPAVAGNAIGGGNVIMAACEYGRRKVSIGTDSGGAACLRTSGDLAVLGNVSMDGGTCIGGGGYGSRCG
jgi:hypothetical protein